MADEYNLPDQELARIIQGIYDGDITEYDLPESLYFAIANYLKKGLYEGWGAALGDLELGTGDYKLLASLRENIYMFSGAKCFNQVQELSAATIDDDGVIRPFGEFKKAAMEIYDRYNSQDGGGWLEAEFDTAVGQGQIATQWNDIEQSKDLLPYLTYVAEEDDLTCEICGPLNVVTFRVDDPFWDIYTPLNHFRCRCAIQQGDESLAPSVTGDDQRDEIAEKVGKEMDDSFKMNPGKDGYVFSPDHLYFSVASKDREFAENNFGLPIPDKD